MRAGGRSLIAALKQREQEQHRIREEVQQIETLRRDGPLDVGPLRADLERRVADWRTSATRSVAQGRQVLRKLLRGRVLMTPRQDGTVELSGQADYGKLFSGLVIPQQRWRPQRDSVPLAQRAALRRATREDRWWTKARAERGIRPQRDSNPRFSLERATS